MIRITQNTGGSPAPRTAAVDHRPSLKRVRPHPEITDPLAKQVMGLIVQSHLSWHALEVDSGAGSDTIRHWFYRPTWNPHWPTLVAVLEQLGYRLRLERTPVTGSG